MPFSSTARCSSAPVTRWRQRGGMTEEECKQKCLDKPSCKFVSYNSKLKICNEYGACDVSNPKNTPAPWRNYRIVSSDEENTPAPTPRRATPSPTPRRATPSPTPGGPGGEAQKFLDRHNLYRCMHGAPPMEWHAGVAAKAQQWADRGQFEHSSSSFRQVSGIGYVGENLAKGWRSLSPEQATDMWYSEVKFTNNGRIDSFTMETGHYTQVVWKKSVYLGCGTNGGLVVCQYGPGGNMGGMFTSNVGRLEKSRAECER